MMIKTKILCSLITLCVLSGCAISRNVGSVDSGTTIEKIYVLDNEKVLMDALVDELVGQISDMGFQSEKYSGDRPEDAKHYLTYTANWKWDMAMYLWYFKATLYEDGNVRGEVEYNAKWGGANLGKFGRTAEKIKPLLVELLADVTRAPRSSELGTKKSERITEDIKTVDTIKEKTDLYSALIELNNLREKGILSDEEYKREKEELLNKQ